MKIALVAPLNSPNKNLSHWCEHLQAVLNPDLGAFGADFVIDWQSTIPIVQDAEKRHLVIDFDNDHLTYERKQLRGKNEPLAKALGFAKGVRRVLDLSVGMAADSVVLSQLGFEVQGVERSPLLYFLLQQAFQQTQREELKKYQLHFGDALTFLKAHRGEHFFEAIYFDPMYPKPEGKKKSALPKQEMVIFRNLVGNDFDADEVLMAALDFGVSKIVVKRPLGAESLGLKHGVKPSHSLETKVVRFDIYGR